MFVTQYFFLEISEIKIRLPDTNCIKKIMHCKCYKVYEGCVDFDTMQNTQKGKIVSQKNR